MTISETAIRYLLDLTSQAVKNSGGISRYDASLYAVYYPRSHRVYLYMGATRTSRMAALRHIQTTL